MLVLAQGRGPPARHHRFRSANQRALHESRKHIKQCRSIPPSPMYSHVYWVPFDADILTDGQNLKVFGQAFRNGGRDHLVDHESKFMAVVRRTCHRLSTNAGDRFRFDLTDRVDRDAQGLVQIMLKRERFYEQADCDPLCLRAGMRMRRTLITNRQGPEQAIPCMLAPNQTDLRAEAVGEVSNCSSRTASDVVVGKSRGHFIRGQERLRLSCASAAARRLIQNFCSVA
jgi:hypothetical protein